MSMWSSSVSLDPKLLKNLFNIPEQEFDDLADLLIQEKGSHSSEEIKAHLQKFYLKIKGLLFVCNKCGQEAIAGFRCKICWGFSSPKDGDQDVWYLCRDCYASIFNCSQDLCHLCSKPITHHLWDSETLEAVPDPDSWNLSFRCCESCYDNVVRSFKKDPFILNRDGRPLDRNRIPKNPTIDEVQDGLSGPPF